MYTRNSVHDFDDHEHPRTKSPSSKKFAHRLIHSIPNDMDNPFIPSQMTWFPSFWLDKNLKINACPNGPAKEVLVDMGLWFTSQTFRCSTIYNKPRVKHVIWWLKTTSQVVKTESGKALFKWFHSDVEAMERAFWKIQKKTFLTNLKVPANQL